MNDQERIKELEDLLKRSQGCIDHTRKWIKNLNPEFQDDGVYKMTSEDISDYFKNKKSGTNN